ncbi:MAG TPA: DUF4097 family beta strand repeat-containing protein [Chthonomonadaceae bacterium]|nr:DUF4097 family beta strand repeat-containing protein [Chthonomonadaceae bacterium]
MDDNVMRVLQMLEEGRISAKEAEMLIAALRGEATSPGGDRESETKDEHVFFSFEKIKTPKLDLDDLGERISKAVSKVQPEKIVKRVQAQLRTATRAGAHWGATINARVRTWTDGADERPENTANLPEHTDTHDLEFHLEPGAMVTVENSLGNVRVTGISDGPATVQVRKVVWGPSEELKAIADRVQVDVHGTDSRLDVKVSAPDGFREGTVDLEIRAPRSVNTRVSTHFGEVEIAQLDGRAEAVTGSGDLRLHDLNGDVRGETASGDLRLERVGGAATVASQSGDISAEDVRRGLSANTASGDVRVSRVEGGRVECKSVSGDASVTRVGLEAPLDITVESVSGDASLTEANGNIAIKAVSGSAQANDVTAARLQAHTVSGDVSVKLREAFSGTMQINTVSGDVSLTLPESSNVRVSLSTTSGDLHCDHDANDVTATDTLWTGQIGTGAGTLNVQTISGDTHIAKGAASASSTSTTSTSSTSAASSESTSEASSASPSEVKSDSTSEASGDSTSV